MSDTHDMKLSIIKDLRFAASSASNRLQQIDAIDKAISYLETVAAPQGVSELADRLQSAVEFIRAAAKPLEWEENKGNYDGQVVWWPVANIWPCWIVKNPDSDNYTWCEEIGIDLIPASPVKGTYSTLEAAQAAVQADCERRLLSILSPYFSDERHRLIAALEKSLDTSRGLQKQLDDLRSNLAANPPQVTLPEIPDDDADFTPDLARKIIAKYQDYIHSLTAAPQPKGE